MAKTKVSKQSIIHENPIILPELTSIAGNKTHIVLKFGYKKHDQCFVVHSSVGLSFQEAREFAGQILEAVDHYEKQK